jgi:threonyl-tRNA synthetase
MVNEQAIILSLSEKYEIYAKKVLDLLENHEIALIDNRSEPLVRKSGCEMQKNPFMLIVRRRENAQYLFVDMARRKRQHYRYD